MNRILERLKISDDNIAIINMPNFVKDFDDINYRKSLNNHELTTIIFISNIYDLKTYIEDIIQNDKIEKNGYLLIAFPKKGNTKFNTFINRDDIFEFFEVDKHGYIKDSLYKFNKMISLNEDYSILGLQRMEKLEEFKNSNDKTDEYIRFIPKIKEFIHSTDVEDIFINLPYGYKKEWAKYIYSSTESEIEIRKKEMIELLKNGIKVKK